MDKNGPLPMLHITVSGDVYLKSRSTQVGLINRFRANLERALATAGYEGQIKRIRTHRFVVTPDTEVLDQVRAAALTVFGVSSVTQRQQLITPRRKISPKRLPPFPWSESEPRLSLQGSNDVAHTIGIPSIWRN